MSPRPWLVALAALALASCGRKGPPLPPLREVPETTTDLAVFQEENQVVLRWSYPSLTRSGRPVGELSGIEVWKAVLPPGQEKALEGPQGAELKRQLLLARGKLLARLSGKELEAATRGELLEFREQVAIPEGQAASFSLYAVRSRKGKGAVSEFSNVVSWQPQVPPPPPGELRAEPQPQGIALRWAGRPETGFRVERRESEGPWSVLGEVTGEAFFDRSALQGHRYAYRVRAVARGVTGPPGEQVTVDYRDVYPPEVPANLVCLPEERRIVLRWEPSQEEGVRFKVFRRLGEGPWVHLEESLEATSYVDQDPPAGELTYAVKAVDRAGNESAAATCTARGGT
jgi:predicted small lipoprotein YifL